mmetsp:Transcript_5867/g.14903  ORF Transcript_5867/g.14903 Transcript_5867/m.14903 type:complete len:278 (-) Transcript_5867:150-983(-)
MRLAPPLAALRLSLPSGQVPTCWCASRPQSARQYAQKAAEQREQLRAKHPSKSTNACLHRGQHSVRMPSMTCSLALRSFSPASAPAAARSRSRLTRRSISPRISSCITSSFILSRARRYASNASWLTLLAMSLSAKCGAVHRSGPFMASVFAGQHTRPSRFLSSPRDLPASLFTYASKQSAQVRWPLPQQMPRVTGSSTKHMVHVFSSAIATVGGPSAAGGGHARALLSPSRTSHLPTTMMPTLEASQLHSLLKKGRGLPCRAGCAGSLDGSAVCEV